mmetsp:Transcript_648/g.2363  ORF Transcript_648/g.2363 Transcript_648/m.2363 type:complete len:326 (+) Transcript_648:964-1941(+)
MVITTGPGPYQEWQTRSCYQTYLAAAADPASKLKAFTRVFHSPMDDALSSFIPTWRINPTSKVKSFPVEPRAHALKAWIQSGEVLCKGCTHIFLGEPDYVFVKPPHFPIPPSGEAVGFIYDYVAPNWGQNKKIIKRLMGTTSDRKVADMPLSGPCPVIIAGEDFRKLAPVFSEVVNATAHDQAAIAEFGWTRDMFAWDIAVIKAGMRQQCVSPPPAGFFSQPPHDQVLGPASILHFTWGTQIIQKDTKEMLWQWDKRQYSPSRTGPIPLPPKWKPGLVLQDGYEVTEGLIAQTTLLVKTINWALKRDPLYSQHPQWADYDVHNPN